MRTAAIFVLVCLTYFGSTTRLAAESAPRWDPIFFTRETTAISNGKTVIDAFTAPQTRDAARRLIGSDVVFIGGTAPPGGTPNLTLRDGVLLQVVLTRKRNILPHAAVWESEVRGTLTKLDFEHRVITITCKPSDWRVRQSM